jgi:hypothetical protein
LRTGFAKRFQPVWSQKGFPLKPIGPPSSLRWPVASKSFGSTGASIGRGQRLVSALFGELEEASENRDEIEAVIEEETEDDDKGKRRAMMLRAVALPSRAGVIVNLSNALRTLVALERQAFNLGDGPDSNDRAPDVPVTDDRLKAALALLLARET